MTTKYISSNDTAKLIRETLKIEFPGVKFSVKKTRGGSVQIEWTDGPTWERVQSVAGFYAGAHFDSMQDLKEYRSHQNEGGERIHYGIDYVLPHRNHSAAFWQRMIDWAMATFAFDEDPQFYVVETSYGGNHYAYAQQRAQHVRFGNEWAIHFLERMANRTNEGEEPPLN